jgi:hypothetical protein
VSPITRMKASRQQKLLNLFSSLLCLQFLIKYMYIISV